MKRQSHKTAGFFRDWEEKKETRRCDHPDCEGEGAYRAPKSRDRLNEYYWFCLDHVRAYNQAWDYYKGCKPEEIEEAIREGATWGRPTWRMGARIGGGRFNAENLEDPFSVFREDGASAKTAARRAPGSAEREAMAVMDLQAPLDVQRIKARYKELCKRHHPDANGGDKAAEEKFKRIGQAYRTLMECVQA